jgi:hypothetical protein
MVKQILFLAAPLILNLLSLGEYNALKAEPFETHEFPDLGQAKHLDQDGILIAITSKELDRSQSRATMRVEVPGHGSHVLEIGSRLGPNEFSLGYGKVSASDAAPSVLVKWFTGGAHCCMQALAIVPGEDQLIEVDLGKLDLKADFDTFPADLDGDGAADFLIGDAAFLNSFSDYPATWLPPRIYNLVSGELVDVSHKRAFQPVFREYAAEVEKSCLDPGYSKRAGACAAFVAAHARLGTQDSAIAAAQADISPPEIARYPFRCLQKRLDDSCPLESRHHFRSFDRAIKWFLTRLGYLEPETAGYGAF